MRELIACFKDGSQGKIEVRGQASPYVDGLRYEFQIGVATRDDGYKRVVFLLGDCLQQSDAWVERVFRAPRPGW